LSQRLCRDISAFLFRFQFLKSTKNANQAIFRNVKTLNLSSQFCRGVFFRAKKVYSNRNNILHRINILILLTTIIILLTCNKHCWYKFGPRDTNKSSVWHWSIGNTYNAKVFEGFLLVQKVIQKLYVILAKFNNNVREMEFQF